MNTLSEQLTNYYQDKWKGLKEQLEANGLCDKLQCPFLISLLRSELPKEERDSTNYVYAEKENPEHEEWYTKADVKLMFFGKETNSWEKNEDVGDTMGTYERFLEDKYVVTDKGGFFSQGSNFFKVGINRMMAGIEDILLDYPGKRASMIWNNISKLSAISTRGGSPVNSLIHDLERKYFHVIPKEIEILQPEILIFYTGPGENNYYRYITQEDNFTMTEEPKPLAGFDKRDVVKLSFKEVKLAYKTWHPVRMKKELREQIYQAILTDIKENIHEILKKA